MPSPLELEQALPLPAAHAARILAARQRISALLAGRDSRFLLVVGPCSIHDPQAAMEYAGRLQALQMRYHDSLEIVMRVYFEKPRTIMGWKGMINDPGMDGSFRIADGLQAARRLLLHLAEIGLPAGSEFLDMATGQYYADTVSWGAIGARTTESQVHRELASGLSCPVGFKNGTSGDVGIAVDAIAAAGRPHAFLSPTPEGRVALLRTRGNPDAHLILRGGQTPNFDEASVSVAVERQRSAGIDRRLIVDCSHANSGKDHRRQAAVLRDIVARMPGASSAIGGLMLESHLVEGKQSLGEGDRLVYGQSITDGCIGWAETEQLIEELAESVAAHDTAG